MIRAERVGAFMYEQKNEEGYIVGYYADIPHIGRITNIYKSELEAEQAARELMDNWDGIEMEIKRVEAGALYQFPVSFIQQTKEES